jgi:hypothetical protein
MYQFLYGMLFAIVSHVFISFVNHKIEKNQINEAMKEWKEWMKIEEGKKMEEEGKKIEEEEKEIDEKFKKLMKDIENDQKRYDLFKTNFLKVLKTDNNEALVKKEISMFIEESNFDELFNSKNIGMHVLTGVAENEKYTILYNFFKNLKETEEFKNIK